MLCCLICDDSNPFKGNKGRTSGVDAKHTDAGNYTLASGDGVYKSNEKVKSLHNQYAKTQIKKLSKPIDEKDCKKDRLKK